MTDTSVLRTMFEAIRDENRTAANTAERIGNAFLALLDLMDHLDLEGDYLSRVSDDTAEGIITFLRGLLIGDGSHGIDSDGAAHLLSMVFDTVLKSKDARKGFLDGRGIYMDAGEELIETGGLNVRGFMRVMELIINRLQLMESDYSFTEGDTVEHVDYEDNGQTLVLTMHKDHDNDYTPFYPGDIIYGIRNDLLPKDAAGQLADQGHIVSRNASYFRTWMRVKSVDLNENKIRVALYQGRLPDNTAIVPGGTNFSPWGTAIGADVAAAMLTEYNTIPKGSLRPLGVTGYDTMLNVTRHGNIADGVNPETGATDSRILQSQKGRQDAWVLSTTDKRLSFFWNVDSPIIRNDNYALILGILPDLPNLPSTRNPNMPSLYISELFCENIHHIYYPPRVVKEDRGEWSSSPTAVYTGPSGEYIPDGTLSEEQQRLMGSGGSFTTGQQIAEPYHFEGVPRNTWLTSRLTAAWSNLTDSELLEKIRVEWHLDLETSRAWKSGTLWECRAEGAEDEPWVTSSEWLLLTTGSLMLRIAMTRQFLRRSDFRNGATGTVLSFVLRAGSDDVSSRIGADCVTWTRQSKGAGADPALDAADEAWNTRYGRHRREISVTENDLPSNFWSEREVQFTCTIETSENLQPMSRTISLH